MKRYLMSLDLKKAVNDRDVRTMGKTAIVQMAPVIPLKTLGGLFYEGYHGSIDDKGQNLLEWQIELHKTLAGEYGPMIQEACFISVEDHILTGCILISLFKNVPFVTYISVAPNFRGQHLAERLLNHACYALNTIGYEKLYLNVTAGNKPAEKTYQKLGFQIVYGGWLSVKQSR